jgi:hypothetical protein
VRALMCPLSRHPYVAFTRAPYRAPALGDRSSALAPSIRAPGSTRAQPLRRLETLEGIVARMRATDDPALQSLILDLEELIRIAVRELQELDADVDDDRR